MTDEIRARIEKAGQRFYDECYKEGEDISHEYLATVMLGMTLNRFRAAGVSIAEIITIIKKHAAS